MPKDIKQRMLYLFLYFAILPVVQMVDGLDFCIAVP